MPSGSINVLEIQRLLEDIMSSRLAYLRFPNSLENEFESARRSRRIAYLVFSGLLGLLLYDAFLVIDYVCLPQRFAACLNIRLLYVTPIEILLLLLLRTSSSVLREIIFVIYVFPAALGIVYLYSGNPLLVVNSHGALLLLILYTNLVVRSKPMYALTATVLGLAGDTAFIVSAPSIDFPQAMMTCSLIWTGAAVSLVGNFHMDKEERISYLRQRVSELRGIELARISSIDSLTGVANRFSFEADLQSLWEQAALREQIMSVLMIDLDHFKVLNDRYGHPYGDLILRSVAQQIRVTCQAEGSIVARYGGEEFIVILPRHSLAQALQQAELIRAAVESLTFTPPDNAPEHHVTVSIGAAIGNPLREDLPAHVVCNADKALYRAKKTGRNCVWPQPQKLLKPRA